MTEQPGGPSLDPAAIQQLFDMTGGDAAFLDELLQSFVDGAETQLHELQRAVAEGSADEVVRPAHSLKSLAGNVGAGRLVELARGLEADARTGTVADAQVRVAAVASELELVKAELVAIRRPS